MAFRLADDLRHASYAFEAFHHTDLADLPVCTACGLVDAGFAPAELDFKVNVSGPFDFTRTYDGATIVSQRFRTVLDDTPGATFTPLKHHPGLFLLSSTLVVPVVGFRGFELSREKWCDQCDRYASIVGSFEPAPEFVWQRGMYRSDEVLGWTRLTEPSAQSPTLYVDNATGELLRSADLLGLYLHSVI